jgi:LuxR family maltose regulon positive regulatory protein
MADFVLVRIFTAKGRYEKVSGVLNQMKTQLETLQHADCIYLYDMISGWFYTKIGRTGQVARWIRHEEEARKILAPVVIGREYLVRSDCLMAEERYYELLAFMEQTDKIYENRGILFAVIQNKITKAILHHNMGSYAESIHNLNEAYKLSHPNNLIVQFIEYGNKMRTLIHFAKLNCSCNIPVGWLDNIYTKSSSYAKMLTQLVSAYDAAHKMDNKSKISLSKRETEVLIHLCRGMTRKEIAANCYISISTANSILKNLYNKLGAVNAADAIRTAKEKGLI